MANPEKKSFTKREKLVKDCYQKLQQKQIDGDMETIIDRIKEVSNHEKVDDDVLATIIAAYKTAPSIKTKNGENNKDDIRKITITVFMDIYKNLFGSINIYKTKFFNGVMDSLMKKWPVGN